MRWQENWEEYEVKLSPVVKIRPNSASLCVFSVNSLQSCFPWNYQLIEICFQYLRDVLKTGMCYRKQNPTRMPQTTLTPAYLKTKLSLT